jgi:hypothetical protein
MADNSNQEETGSQRTQQSTRNKNTNTTCKGDNKHENRLQGNLTELGDNVHKHGSRDQGDTFTKTTEATANHVGRERGKEMRLLAKNQEEHKPMMMSHHLHPFEATTADPAGLDGVDSKVISKCSNEKHDPTGACWAKCKRES